MWSPFLPLPLTSFIYGLAPLLLSSSHLLYSHSSSPLLYHTSCSTSSPLLFVLPTQTQENKAALFPLLISSKHPWHIQCVINTIIIKLFLLHCVGKAWLICTAIITAVAVCGFCRERAVVLLLTLAKCERCEAMPDS